MCFMSICSDLIMPNGSLWVGMARDAVSGAGRFRYAPSYLEAGLPWSIDPVNLPLGVAPMEALRYGGLQCTNAGQLSIRAYAVGWRRRPVWVGRVPKRQCKIRKAIGW